MPHVIVKMYTGRTEQQKVRLAREVTRAVTSALQCPEGWVSVAIEEVAPRDWATLVHEPDIVGKAQTLYKKSDD